jgi:peptidyl-prolyl cis-trans isomerase D
MLAIFRKAANTWIAKLLLGLLALAFTSWGVGDIRNAAFGTGPAVVVGDVSMSAGEVSTEFKRQLENMQPRNGPRLTSEDARKMGLMDAVIESLVTRLLLDEAGRRLGLATSDEAIRAAVFANPMFRNEAGAFDRTRLQMVLGRMGLSEEAFMRQERSYQTRQQLGDALSSGVAAPKLLVDPLARYRLERRIADVWVVKDAAVAQPPAPDAATLETYYKANADRFMAPEYRGVTVLLLRPADVAGQVEVTDEMIAEAYGRRRAEFDIPERRVLSQVVASDPEAASKAAGLVAAGKDVGDIATALGTQVIDLGSVEAAELPAEIAKSAFAQAPGTTGAPIKTDLGWHVVKVSSVTPGKVRSLAEVRGQVEQDLRHEKAGDSLADLSNKVDDALGGGASLEEAARRFNLTLIKAEAIDVQGRGPDGKAVANLPKAPSFLDVAFHSDPGTESQLTDNGGDGYFMVRVDQVTPPAPRPLAEVKGQVAEAWQAEQRHKAARARADKIAEELKAGQRVHFSAAETRITPPFTRDGGEGSGLPPAAVSELFAAAVGQVVVAPADGGWLVARLGDIIPFDAAAHPKDAETVRHTLSQAVMGDIMDQYMAALNAKVGVKVDRSQLSREE